MRNEIKGALAAAAGVTLLLTGGGTFAVWTDAQTISGGNLNSGRLGLLTDATNTGCANWQLDTGESVPSTYNAGDPLVPGDVLSRQCRFTIQAIGNHLRAGVAISSANFTGAGGNFGGMLTADVSNIRVNGGAATSFTDDNNGQTLTATVTVTFNSAATNGTQNLATTLAAMTLTATQIHA